MLSGASYAEVRRALGLNLGSFRKTLLDSILAPLTYLGAWPLLFIVLVVYSLILSLLGADVKSGTHPIVPLLMSSDENYAVYFVVILAVLVAPIVEEIMFRGALYTWLRGRMRKTWAILASAFLFALVHPQGAVGVVPLTFIGIVLAFLREWRGTLLAPMVAHACFNAGTLLLFFLLFR